MLILKRGGDGDEGSDADAENRVFKLGLKAESTDFVWGYRVSVWRYGGRGLQETSGPSASTSSQIITLGFLLGLYTLCFNIIGLGCS